jgi:hypothetical protein
MRDSMRFDRGKIVTAAAAKPAQEFSRIEREQSAFDSQLDEMIRSHEGEFVVFKDQKPFAFFPTYEEAYRAGLEQFGIDDVFFVSEVKRRVPQTTSMAWEAGVMFTNR